jgi:predicted RNase H-like nuclease
MRCTERYKYKASRATALWKGQGLARPQLLRRVRQAQDAILRQLGKRIGGIAIVESGIELIDTFRTLKQREDRIDALICAWTAIEYLDGSIVAFGDHNAAVWVPRAALLKPQAALLDDVSYHTPTAKGPSRTGRQNNR